MQASADTPAALAFVVGFAGFWSVRARFAELVETEIATPPGSNWVGSWHQALAETGVAPDAAAELSRLSAKERLRLVDAALRQAGVGRVARRLIRMGRLAPGLSHYAALAECCRREADRSDDHLWQWVALRIADPIVSAALAQGGGAVP